MSQNTKPFLDCCVRTLLSAMEGATHGYLTIDLPDYDKQIILFCKLETCAGGRGPVSLPKITHVSDIGEWRQEMFSERMNGAGAEKSVLEYLGKLIGSASSLSTTVQVRRPGCDEPYTTKLSFKCE